MSQHEVPDLMPVLSRGKHRSPRKGACFMELASYLAGEPWSDHPRCTHGVLAALAREVNDNVGDAGRLRLAPLIPEVVGLDGEDRRVDAWIARDAALTALPIVAEERQRALAVGLYRCERHLALLEGRPLDDVDPATRAALDAVPHARDWARRYVPRRGELAQTFRERSAPAIVHASVAGIAVACAPDVESTLVDLLARTIERCQGWFGRPSVARADDRWREACTFTLR